MYIYEYEKAFNGRIQPELLTPYTLGATRLNIAPGI